MFTKEECKEQLIKECQIKFNDGSYRSTRSTSRMLSRTHRKNLKDSIVFHTSYLSNNVKLSERIYHILYNLQKEVVCKNDNCSNKVKFDSGNTGYREHCSHKCSMLDKNVRAKCKNACLKKYGAEHYTFTEDYRIKNKILWDGRTDKEIKSIVDRRSITNLEKYGVENTFQVMKKLVELSILTPATQDEALKIFREELEEGLKTHR